MKNIIQQSEKENNNITIYQSDDGEISFNVNIFDETVWLTQKQMAELFEKDRTVITRHINNIFKEGEADKKSNVHFLHFANSDKPTALYNLDVIISVGYRVKSPRGIQFRKWATNILKQHLLNGYSVNERRITQIEKLLEKLVKNSQIAIEDNKMVKEEIKIIYKKLADLASKPINIYNQISLTDNKQLEQKALELLDELIKEIKSNNRLKTEIQQVQDIIKTPTKDNKDKAKIINFFTDLGDDKSDLNKAIKGAQTTGKIIDKLVKLGEKLKDLIW